MRLRRAWLGCVLAACAAASGPPVLAASMCTAKALARPEQRSVQDAFRQSCGYSRDSPAVVVMFREAVPCEGTACATVNVSGTRFQVQRALLPIRSAVLKLENEGQVPILANSAQVLHVEWDCAAGLLAPKLSPRRRTSARAQSSQRWGMEDAGVPEVVSDSERNIAVAILDSGIDCKHPDLRHRMASSDAPIGIRRCPPGAGTSYYYWKPDLPPDNCDATPDPVCGNHGTSVAGVVAADGVFKGVDPRATLVSMRILDQTANLGATIGDIAASVLDSAAANAQILNISAAWEDDHPVIAAAFDYVTEQQGRLIVVAAATLSLGRPAYPGLYSFCNPAVIGVAGLSRRPDGKYGRVAFSYNHEHVLFAAGADVYSTDSATKVDYSKAYRRFDGSSMAAPHVSGAASLVWKHADFARCSSQAIRELLYCSARKTRIENLGDRKRLHVACLLGDRSDAACDYARQCIDRVLASAACP